MFIVDYFPKHSILDIWQGFEYTSAIFVQKYCLFHMFQSSEDKTEISHKAKAISVSFLSKSFSVPWLIYRIPDKL